MDMNVFHLVVKIKNSIEHFVLTITNPRDEKVAKATAEGQGLEVASVHTNHAEAAAAVEKLNANTTPGSVVGEPRTLDAVLAQTDKDAAAAETVHPA